MANYQWTLMLDASLDGGQKSEAESIHFQFQFYSTLATILQWYTLEKSKKIHHM